ncbi:hypothetical protein GALMADRAFT_565953 [Galerina marginata CBS 339.88]|uniref:Uncharacterized protein n=1 Tax=Galerina marginata (strain CBS 339.88) TaxID=685588 RepID=A0A067SVC2_GALM3|nr:hypothetical protein GALMADRAFT_565953 [Galerina marginata CBS 339.88]
MEDVTTMPAAVAMTSIDEDRSSESLHSRDNSQVSRYSPMPTSPNNMPLLRDEDADAAYGDLSLQSLSPEGEDMPRLRRHSDVGSHETSSLMRAEDSNAHLPDTTELAQDPRGDAPPYFEVVDLTEVHHNRTNSDGSIGPLVPQSQSHLIATSDPATNTNAMTTTTTDTTTNANTNTNRRSGFRTLLNRMSMVGHTRNESSSSNFSSNLPVSHPRPSTSTSHHSRPSTSMSMFRTLSRQRSTHTLNSASASNSRLTSPSLISLHSISAPLTHTVTRTEFTYPKSGPTAEQLKVISSRESFARFGMPYGADAIAFAASASGLNLSGIPDEPPPGFEEGPSQTQRAPTPGPSRLRTESRAGASTPPPVTVTQENAQPQSAPSTMPPQAPSSAPAAIPLTTAAPPPGLPLTHTPAAETPYSSISKNHNGSTPSPTPTAEPKHQPETAQNTASSPPAPTPSVSPSSTSNPNRPPSVSEFGKLSIPPPSSYTSASASASSTRSESRASVFSYQSYATAAESLTPSSAQAFFSDADADSDADVDAGDMTSEPSTPKMGGKHVLEMTDATVVPGDREGGDDRRRTILAAAGIAGTSSLAR